MKILLVVIIFVFAFPGFVQALPDTTHFLNDEIDTSRTDELSNPARKGSVMDQIRDADQPLQARTSKKGKPLPRDKNRTSRATPSQNCDPNDIQCMRTQDINTIPQR